MVFVDRFYLGYWEMNDRIKELFIETYGISPAGFEAASIPVEIEKFAKLLINECYEHCKGEMLDNDTAEEFGLGYNDGVMDCALGLLQHFGMLYDEDSRPCPV
jgi:hypothetical protein